MKIHDVKCQLAMRLLYGNVHILPIEILKRSGCCDDDFIKWPAGGDHEHELRTTAAFAFDRRETAANGVFPLKSGPHIYNKFQCHDNSTSPSKIFIDYQGKETSRQSFRICQRETVEEK